MSNVELVTVSNATRPIDTIRGMREQSSNKIDGFRDVIDRANDRIETLNEIIARASSEMAKELINYNALSGAISEIERK